MQKEKNFFLFIYHLFFVLSKFSFLVWDLVNRTWYIQEFPMYLTLKLRGDEEKYGTDKPTWYNIDGK